jgi:hypothetical protein
MVAITAIVVVVRLHREMTSYLRMVSRQRGLRQPVLCGDQELLRIVRKRVPLARRQCGAGSRAMGRIWIAMRMGWGVSRGGSDVGVMLKRAQSKTEAQPVVLDHAIRSETISFDISRKREVDLTRMALT